MSAKKSWDVQPRKRAAAPAAAPTPAPAAQPRSARSAPSASRQPASAASTPTHSLPSRPQSRATGRTSRLRERRRQQRRVQGIALGIFLSIIMIGGFYAVWMPTLRIQTVTLMGPDQEGAQQLATQSLHGTYAFIVPRDSIFFYSSGRIRSAILRAYPDIAAVSIHRSSFHSLNIATTPRSSAFIWCGTSADTPPANGICYDADADGMLFQPAVHDAVGSSTLRIFGPLMSSAAADGSPIRAHVVNAAAIPNALRFVKAMRQLGAPVSALGIHDDEADLWLQGPTRITYILGHEEQATQLAASALPTLNLTNGSVQYVDLRFEGKVYVKKYGG